jgi:hypothetical protein
MTMADSPLGHFLRRLAFFVSVSLGAVLMAAHAYAAPEAYHMMDARTGEVVAMAAGPTFDPNNRPANPTSGNPDDSPLFNRAVQGIYELGSTFKIFLKPSNEIPFDKKFLLVHFF